MRKNAILLFALLLFPSILPAQSEKIEEQIRAIAAELRCPVCQNQPVADSPAELAKQMRAVIRQQLEEGKSPEEIRRDTPQEGLLAALSRVTADRFPRVLIVDDTEQARRLIRRILQSQGNYTIFESANGRQAIEMAKKVKKRVMSESRRITPEKTRTVSVTSMTLTFGKRVTMRDCTFATSRPGRRAAAKIVWGASRRRDGGKTK